MREDWISFYQFNGNLTTRYQNLYFDLTVNSFELYNEICDQVDDTKKVGINCRWGRFEIFVSILFWFKNTLVYFPCSFHDVRKIVLQGRICRMVLYVLTVAHSCLFEVQGVSTWQKETAEATYIHDFLMNLHELQSNNDTLSLPTIPSGIVARAFKLFWDKLCRNSCIQVWW